MVTLKLKCLQPTSVLVFSYVGYVAKEVTVGDQKTINVNLAPESNTLENVEVVAIGYGNLAAKEVTSCGYTYRRRKIQAKWFQKSIGSYPGKGSRFAINKSFRFKSKQSCFCTTKGSSDLNRKFQSVICY